MPGPWTGRTVARMLVLRLLAMALVATLTLVGTASAAKPKQGTVRVAAPAAGKVNLAVATAAPGAKLKVKKAPTGVGVAGGVAADGTVLIAVTAKPKARKGSVIVGVRGGKPSGLRVVGDVLARGGVPAAACKDLTRVLGRGLRGMTTRDASALAAKIAAAGCKAAPQPASGVATPLTSATTGKPFGSNRPPGSGTGSTTRPGGGTGGTGGGGGGGGGDTGGTPECANGIDDDGDGQTDARGPGVANPDPGCYGSDDDWEVGETAVSDDCRNSSGVFGGANGPASAAAAINDPCPVVEDAWMTIAPGVTSCTASSAASNYACTAENGLLHVSRQSGLADNRIDFFTIALAGAADCSATPTIAIQSPDGSMYELVEPWPPSCGSGDPTDPPDPLCSNGVDDDGDGQTDAPNAPNATDPDPGCTTAADQTESSEVAIPDTCSVQMGYTGSDQRNTAFSASGCGELNGAWFSPSRTPQSCELVIDFGDPVGCGIIGPTASTGFDDTSADLFMRAPVAQAPACGAALTTALRRSDGVVMEARGFWLC